MLFPIMLPGAQEQLQKAKSQGVVPHPSGESSWDYFKKGWQDAGGLSSLPGILGDVVREKFGQPAPPMPGYPDGYLPGLKPQSPLNPGVPVTPWNETPWASADKIPGNQVMDETSNVGGLLSTLLKQQGQV